MHEKQELGEHWGEKGRTTQFNLHKCLTVHCNNALHTDDLWIVDISVKCEAMTDFLDAAVVWYSAEAEHWEALITIIRFYNLSNILYCRFVLVVDAR